MRRFVVLAGASLFGACVIGVAACGTKPLPFAELDPVDAETIRMDARSGGDGAGPNGENITCYDPESLTPDRVCECLVTAGPLSATLPCGWGICLSSTMDEHICVAANTVVRVPGCRTPFLDAGDAGDNFRLPPCEAGARGGDPDASADADADASPDPDASPDADADGG